MNEAKTTKTYEAACPQGHTEGLELRRIVDGPPLVDGIGGMPYLVLDMDEASEADVEGTAEGSDCGVWCSTCREWYGEAECIREKATE